MNQCQCLSASASCSKSIVYKSFTHCVLLCSFLSVLSSGQCFTCCVHLQTVQTILVTNILCMFSAPNCNYYHRLTSCSEWQA
jgi:hypothetical protein